MNSLTHYIIYAFTFVDDNLLAQLTRVFSFVLFWTLHTHSIMKIEEIFFEPNN